MTLGHAGRCYEAQGQPAEAEQHYRQELEELTRLEQSEEVRTETGIAWTDLELMYYSQR